MLRVPSQATVDQFSGPCGGNFGSDLAK